MSDTSLRITEIFVSLQGEAATAGYPTVFVRLTGCPLRCNYCDSEYAFFGGEKLALSDIVDKVEAHGVAHVCVTGGEPLAQPNCLPLLGTLCEKGYAVSLETSGAMDISGVDHRVSVVLDLKTPGSGEVDKNRYTNIEKLQHKDQVKFVVSDRKDFDWACLKVDEFGLSESVSEVLISPVYERVEPRELADWVVQSKRKLRFQMQMHKLLWGDKPGV